MKYGVVYEALSYKFYFYLIYMSHRFVNSMQQITYNIESFFHYQSDKFLLNFT